MAIVSDLHCHEAAFKPQESWLIAGARRLPAGNHPVQALISLIKDTTLTSDVLICPGDLANRVSQSGMMQSWDHLRELKIQFGASLLIATLGNHDVDSHKTNSPDPFDIPRNLHEDFPVSQGHESTGFWSDGFYFKRGPDNSDFLVLNTVLAHNDELTAKRGTFDFERISRLKEALQERQEGLYSKGSTPCRIAVMHHHPLLHSSVNFGSADVLEFGDQLLDLLTGFGFRFVLHGHRHDPRVTRRSSGASDYFVFAAGSFSAILKELGTWTRNLFHIVKLRFEDNTGRFIGQILTWEYSKGSGWRPSTTVSAKLPHLVEFCAPCPKISLQEIEKKCDAAVGSLLRADEINANFPDVCLLLPKELEDLRISLSNIGIKMIVAPEGPVESIGRPAKISP